MLTPRAGSTASASRFKLLSLLLALAMVAVSCGGDGDGGGDEAANEDRGAQPSEVPEDEGEPQMGGDLVFGLEADTSNPWTPAKSICAISCHQVMKSVYDSLTLPDPEGIAQPNLLESFEPNADFTEWTLTPRAGVTFHDGTPFDAEAIRANLQDHLDSSLTQVAFKSIESIATTPDGSAAVVTMNKPWSRFPIFLTGQLGMMASPTWLAATKAGTAQETAPVGTGPFVFEEYQVGNRFRASKNPDYWKQDAEGRQLPYADSIEFRILPDAEARVNALQSGQLNMLHTSAGQQIDRLRENDAVDELESDAFGETNYILLNVDEGPDSEANEAIRDVRVRRALAHGYNVQQIVDTQGRGVGEVGNGPFPPGTIGYLEDTGFPEYDPEEARRLVDEYEAENGPIEISFSTTTDPANLETNQIIQGMWQAVGIDAELRQVEQGSYILEAAFGTFEAFAWRNHGGYDPDQQNVWWHSDSTEPKGAIALNFGRFQDDVIDENLEIIRSSDDEDERREAAEAVNRRFGEQVYNLWGSWTVWAIGHAPEVNGLTTATLPDGGEALAFPATDKYAIELANVWIGQ